MVGRTEERQLRRSPRERSRTRSRHLGQSLVEFSIIMPVLLTIVGIVIDVSRVYQAWTNLESATRDAAQYLATSNADPTSPQYTTQGTNSDNKAIFILNDQTGMTFTRSSTQGTLTSCTAPQVTTTYTENTSLASGGTTANPVGTAHVTACIPFRTLFSYPLITNNGTWVVQSDRTYKILVGR